MTNHDLPRQALTASDASRTRGRNIREHIPVYMYHLLRRLDRGPIRLGSLHGIEDEAAVEFLVTRGLASIERTKLVITPSGDRIGEIEEAECSEQAAGTIRAD